MLHTDSDTRVRWRGEPSIESEATSDARMDSMGLVPCEGEGGADEGEEGEGESEGDKDNESSSWSLSISSAEGGEEDVEGDCERSREGEAERVARAMHMRGRKGRWDAGGGYWVGWIWVESAAALIYASSLSGWYQPCMRTESRRETCV